MDSQVPESLNDELTRFLAHNNSPDISKTDLCWRALVAGYQFARKEDEDHLSTQLYGTSTENRADLCKCGHPRYTHNGCCKHCGPKCRDFRLQQSQRNVANFHRNDECPICHHLIYNHDEGPGNTCRASTGYGPCSCTHFASYDEMNLLFDPPPEDTDDTEERLPDHQCHYPSHQELQRQHYDDDPDPESSCSPIPPDPPWQPRPGNSTDHYRAASGHEAIDVIESWSLNFSLGSALKYICRAALKPDSSYLEDLRKALWYLNREVQRLQNSPHGSTVDLEEGGRGKTEKGEQRGKVPVDQTRSTAKKANKIQI